MSHAGQDTGGSSFFYVLEDAIRILFVDDDPILREFAQVHLTTERASLTVAEDGVAAMEALAAAEPDVVLLDLEMPRMDGFEVLARMRADPALAHIPVVVVTGREDVAAVDRAYQAGATSFVVKPLNWRLLSYQIRYVHRTHQGEMALSAAETRAREALTEVCAAGSRFLASALGANPELKGAGAPYLHALERASGALGGAAAAG
jgi:CheY-like chemotaxis protein